MFSMNWSILFPAASGIFNALAPIFGVLAGATLAIALVVVLGNVLISKSRRQ